VYEMHLALVADQKIRESGSRIENKPPNQALQQTGAACRSFGGSRFSGTDMGSDTHGTRLSP
jgi:hypothetical protein